MLSLSCFLSLTRPILRGLSTTTIQLFFIFINAASNDPESFIGQDWPLAIDSHQALYNRARIDAKSAMNAVEGLWRYLKCQNNPCTSPNPAGPGSDTSFMDPVIHLCPNCKRKSCVHAFLLSRRTTRRKPQAATLRRTSPRSP